MNRQQAWESLEKKWMLDRHIPSDGNLMMVQHYLKSLRSQKLPIRAIVDIEQLLVYHELYLEG